MSRGLRWARVALAIVLVDFLASAQMTERVSVDSSGAQANLFSYTASISSDGRFTAFQSFASNLVAGDTNGLPDIFVRAPLSGITDRASVATSGAEANSPSSNPSISGDGRFVAFESAASNLVAGDTMGHTDIFVRDRLGGTTERVSVTTGGAQGNTHSSSASISADGRFVAFLSSSGNLVAGDTNGFDDIFVRDRSSGTTELVSVATGGAQGNSNSFTPSISADGRFVAFRSYASNLVAGDTNFSHDIFVRDRQSGTTERVSVGAGGVQANSDSYTPSISGDGRVVAFFSNASNLVRGGMIGSGNIYIRDRRSGITERVNVALGGAQADFICYGPSISRDGRLVAYYSQASNLVANDTNGLSDIFVRDRQSESTERVSVGPGGVQPNADCQYPSISADGRCVAFDSLAWNLVAGDTNLWNDVFVRDRGQPPIVASCFGDETQAPCPCGNTGLGGQGCENSSGTGGALLTPSGSANLSADTLVLASSGEKPTALSIFLQGSALIAPVVYGDGLRCVAGTLKRLYVVNASGGVASAPPGGGPPVSVRSAALGDPIPMGATRHYQTYYRDSNLAFCPSPPGNSWNVSNALSVIWSP